MTVPMKTDSTGQVVLDEALRRKVAALIGLGVRGRLVVSGTEQVRQKVQKGLVRLAVVSTDVSHHTLDKLMPLLRARRVDVLEWPSSAELGAITGRASVAAVGVLDVDLAQGIRKVAAGAEVAAVGMGAARKTGMGGRVE